MGFEKNNDGEYISKVTKYSLILTGAWTLIVAVSLELSYLRESDEARDAASLTAQAQFSKDVIARRWNASHGGVYVPITESTPPNPYLSHTPDRDVETSSGLRLTLVNPAYMTRQIHELDWKTRDVYSHITSLNPIRPDNAADPWETRALESLEKGTQEFSSIETVSGEPYLRQMQPLITEQACLECHAQHGYKLGDVRGGISVSVPMTPYLAIAQQDFIEAAAAHSALWLLGLIGLAFGARRIRFHVAESNRAEEMLRESEILLNQVGDVARIGGWEMDLVTRKARWTQATYDIVEIEPGQAIPGPDEHIEYYLPQYRSMISEAMRALIEDDQPLDFEAEALTAKGNTKWFRALGTAEWTDGKCVRAFGTLQDITEQKQAEAALRESERKYARLVQESPDIIVSLDGSGRLLSFNPMAEEITGYRESEVIGRHFAEVGILIEESTKKALEEFAAILAGTERPPFDLIIAPKQGDHVSLETSARLTGSSAEDTFVQVVMRDITVRRQAEEALRDSQERLELALEGAGLGMWDQNLQTKEVIRDGRWAEMLGYSADEINGDTLSWKELIHPDDLPQIERAAHVHEIGQSTLFRAEHRLKTKSGGWKWILNWGKVTEREADGSPIRAVGIHLDIDDRKRAEEAQKRSEQKYRDFFEKDVSGSYLSTPCGKLLDCNRAFADMLGFESTEDLLGTTTTELYPSPEDQERFIDRLKEDGRLVDYEIDLVRQDGRLIHCIENVVGVFDDAGQLVQFQGYIMDISERKQNEELLRTQYELSRKMGAAESLEECLEACLEATFVVSGMDSGGIYIVDPDSGAVDLAYQKGLAPEFVEASLHYEPDHPNAQLIAGGEPIYTEHSQLLHPVQSSEGLRALAVLPLKHEGRVIACVNIASHTVKEVSPASRHALETIVSHVGSAIARKMVEEELASQTERLTLALRGGDLGIWEWDLETGQTDIDEGWARMLGYTLAEIKPSADTWRVLVHPEDMPRVQAVWDDYNEGKTSYYEAKYRMCHKSGHWVWILDRGHVTERDEHGKPVKAAGTHFDVSRLINAQKAVEESEQKFRTLFDAGQDTITVARIDETGHTGQYLEVNDIACQLFGYSRDELLQMGPVDLHDPSVPVDTATTAEELQRTGHALFERLILTKDKRPIPVEVNARLFQFKGQQAVLSIGRDITERKQAEEALMESENRLRTAGRAAYDLIYEWDPASGSLQWFGDIDGCLGCEDGEISEHTQAWLALIHDDDRDQLMNAVEHHKTSTNPINYEYRIRHKNGSYRVWADRALPVLDEAGLPTKWVGVCTDITERKAAEGKLVQATTLLRDTQRLARLGGWEYDVATGANIWTEEVYDIYLVDMGFDIDDIDAVLSLYHSEDRDRVSSAFWNAVKTGTAYDLEVRLESEGGEVRWVRTIGEAVVKKDQVVKIRGNCQDITAHKVAKKALEDSETKYRMLVETMHDGLVLIDESGNFTFVNQRVCTVLGYGMDELIGRSAISVIDPADVDLALSEMVKRTEGVGNSYELRIRRKDGEVVTAIMAGQPILASDGTYQGTLATMTDITDRKAAENEVLESEAKFRMISDQSLMGIIILQDESFVYVNDRAAQTMETSVEEIARWSPGDYAKLIHPDDLAFVMEQGRKKQAGEMDAVTNYNWRMVTPGGTVKWIDMWSKTIPFRGRLADMVTMIDITEQKQAEQHLRESEERYRVTAEQTGQMVYDYDPRTGQIRWLGAIEEMTGHSATEFSDFNVDRWSAMIHPDDREETLAILDESRKRCGTFDVTYRFRRKDGTYIHTEEHGVFLPDEQGQAYRMLGTMSDITKRKQADNALRQSEAHLHTLIETIPDLVWLKDPEGVYLACNRRFEQFFGATEKQIVGKTDFDFMSSELADFFRNHDRMAAEAGAPLMNEEEIAFASDGHKETLESIKTPLLDSNGDLIGVLGVGRDITERKRAEEALRESEDKFRRYVSHAPGGIFIADGQGRYVDVNEAACTMTGYSRSELLGMSLFELADPETPPEGFESFARLKTTGQANSEISLRCKDGTTVWVSFDAVALSDDRFMAFCTDITETKRLRESESRAARLETAGTIAGQVAHDFNNLLAPIIAYPEFIHDDLPHDHAAHAYLDAIETAAAKMAVINQDLLTMGRRGHYNQEVFDLNRVILQAAQEMESRTKTVTVDTDLCEDLMSIKGGAAQIHRMVTNLLVNAQDAMEDMGQITIRTENYYADDTSIAFGRVPKGEFVKLTVSDNGCGIPSSIIQKILDPFFSTKTSDKKRGSGLGLSVVDAVMKDHDGFLDLSSSVGQGTSFYLYFPVTREDNLEASTELMAGGSEAVLIVDDDDMQREVSSRLLTRLGYEVNSVVSGEEAIEHVRENPPDLVILDMVMPGGIDGTETYRQILEINPRQKAIILSGFSESDRVLEAQQLGAGAFVKKPITKTSIAGAVRAELDRQVETLAP